MLKKVRKLLRDRSPDWLNTEVNKNLLPNVSAPLSKGGWGDLDPSPEQVKPSYIKSEPSEVKRSLPKSSPLPTVKGTPHWRRIKQVFQVLDTSPEGYTYNQLIEYVRATTGKGCSRKLISKWKKQKRSYKLPDNSSGDRQEDPVGISEEIAFSAASPIPCNQTIEQELSTACTKVLASRRPNMGVNSLQLNQLIDNSSINDSLNRPAFLPIKTWSYLAAAGITIALVGCEILPFNNRPTENLAIASVTAPITPLTPIPERRRNRLQAKKKQLQLSLEKLNLPLTPIAKPKPIPEISPLPPVSYAEAEAAIKLKQQKLTEAERAIALQQKKINSLKQLDSSSQVPPLIRGVRGDQKKGSTPNLKLILEHEQANLKNLEAARQSAQIQLEVAQSKLTTAKEQRAYIEYQRQLEQTRRAIAIQQQQQAIASQKSQRERLLAERQYSQAQIETQIQSLDYQIEQLSSVRAPYEGTIKKVKWTGQSDHNLTAVVTLAVSSDRPTVANGTDKLTPNTEVKQTTQAQP